MNAGKPKILFCGILYAMIFHEDELISLNTPAKSTHNIFLHRHRNPVLTSRRWGHGGRSSSYRKGLTSFGGGG